MDTIRRIVLVAAAIILAVISVAPLLAAFKI